MSMVTKPPVLDESYKAAAASREELLKEQNALLRVIAQDKMAGLSQSWSGISHLSKAGEASKIFNIGDMLSDTWRDTAAGKDYTFDWHIADFQNVETKLGTTEPGMVIQAHWLHPFGVQFSHPRAFLVCPDGLAAGTYYFTIERKLGNNVAAGDVVCFTVKNAIPAGGRIAGCYFAPDSKKSDWRIYVYSADGKTILETATPTFTANGTNLGVQHLNAREGNLNSTQEMAYGGGRWKTSAIRQYLNSSAEKGEWWTAQDEWDIAPEQLSEKAGFLSGLPEDMLEAIRLTKVVTYTNTVQDGGKADITWDKVFLPSLEQMYIQPQISGEGEAWEYWKQVNGTSTKYKPYNMYPELIHHAVENHTIVSAMRLRSANRGYSHVSWAITSSGKINDSGGAYPNPFSPACVI